MQPNPTPVRLGMTPTFQGRRYRVAGRVLMGMEEEGTVYYWNEFHLTSEDGPAATLVYEDTERGPEWRLFTELEVAEPLLPEEAASKQVGDRFTLNGREVLVTLVDESTVYGIEGEAPPGVEVGDVARYFNAESQQQMVVVSWTGTEVEYYRGVTIPSQAVARALQLPLDRFPNAVPPMSRSLYGSKERREESSGFNYQVMSKIVSGALILLAVIAALLVYRPSRPSSRPVALPAPKPASHLQVGKIGTLDGKSYQIDQLATVEVAHVGSRFLRTEYQLIEPDGKHALLVRQVRPSDLNWFLFEPWPGSIPFTSHQAAALRAGETLRLDGGSAVVQNLGRYIVTTAAGNAWPGSRSGETYYGFFAQEGPTTLLARWNEHEMVLYRGQLIAAQAVEAFGRPAPR